MPDPDDDKKEPMPFSFYHFIVDPEGGFRLTDGFCRDGLLKEVRTWRALTTSMDLNFIEDGSQGMTSLNYNRDQQKKAQAGAKSEKRKGLTLNPLKTLNKPDDSGLNILLKTVDLEFEVRRSHLTDFYAQDYLASCIAEIKFDEENIEDL